MRNYIMNVANAKNRGTNVGNLLLHKKGGSSTIQESKKPEDSF